MVLVQQVAQFAIFPVGINSDQVIVIEQQGGGGGHLEFSQDFPALSIARVQVNDRTLPGEEAVFGHDTGAATRIELHLGF